MKKITYIFLLIMTPLLAQIAPNTITVLGEVSRKVEIKEYNAIVILSEIKSDNYQNLESISLNDISQKFQVKLQEIGIDFKDFKENIPYELFSISEKKKKVVYNYKTKSLKKIRAFTKIYMNGVNITNVEVKAKDLSVDEMVNLSNKAIENAKEFALKLAKKQHRKLGKIIGIVNVGGSSQSVDGYGSNAAQVYSVTVSFELL